MNLWTCCQLCLDTRLAFFMENFLLWKLSRNLVDSRIVCTLAVSSVACHQEPGAAWLLWLLFTPLTRLIFQTQTTWTRCAWPGKVVVDILVDEAAISSLSGIDRGYENIKISNFFLAQKKSRTSWSKEGGWDHPARLKPFLSPRS